MVHFILHRDSPFTLIPYRPLNLTTFTGKEKEKHSIYRMQSHKYQGMFLIVCFLISCITGILQIRIIGQADPGKWICQIGYTAYKLNAQLVLRYMSFPFFLQLI